NDEKPQTALKYARRILPYLKKSGLKIIMEPGRFIVGNAGILVTKVLYVKTTPKKKFVIIDAGMNDLVRPALYGAYHQILPLRTTNDPSTSPFDVAQGKLGAGARRTTVKVDIVGPICESGDFLAKERLMPPVQEGAYLAVMGAGAYGFSMASNYNSRRRPQEVMVVKDKVLVIRKRETFRDLINNEEIPPALSGL
ncbi:MAG: hypothetical protein Q8O22_00085, partial [Candidatus Omnitrophota bacterium]|nr:hypothetical protein [Candidatus Omnitrophota bacterium]